MKREIYRCKYCKNTRLVTRISQAKEKNHLKHMFCVCLQKPVQHVKV